MRPRDSHRSEVMGRDSIWRLLFRFSGPTIISMLITSSYNIVDAIYVGRLGSAATAALAVFFPINMVWMAFAQGTGVGASSLISRNLGAKNYQMANRIFGVVITLTVAFAVLVTLISLPNVEATVRLFGASGPVIPLASVYTLYHVMFLFVFLFFIILGHVIRAEGNPVLASSAQIASAVTNVILDPIFIFGWGPIPEMGVAGAAIATVAAWWVALGIYLVYFIRGKSSFRLSPGSLKPDFVIIRDIYRIGVASISRLTAGSVVMAIGNVVAASFGVVPLAVKGVLLRAVSFAFMPCMGVGQGVLPLLAYNFGARKKGRIGEILIKAVTLTFGWGALCFLLVMFFPMQIMAVFNRDPEFLQVGTTAIRLFSMAAFTVGIQMISSFYFQATGQGFASLVLASTRQIIFLLPALFILPRLFGIAGLWFSFPVADLLAFAVTLTWTGRSLKKMGIRLTYHAGEEEPAPAPVIGVPVTTPQAGGIPPQSPLK